MSCHFSGTSNQITFCWKKKKILTQVTGTISWDYSGDVDEVEVQPPAEASMDLATYDVTLRRCDITGIYPGEIFRFVLTPLKGRHRGTSSMVEVIVPPDVQNDPEIVSKVTTEESASIATVVTFTGEVKKWHLDFEPGDNLDSTKGFSCQVPHLISFKFCN